MQRNRKLDLPNIILNTYLKHCMMLMDFVEVDEMPQCEIAMICSQQIEFKNKK